MLDCLGLEAVHKGETWYCKCPSGRHEDRRPSFGVRDCPGEPRHGLGWCFSCHWGGTAAELVRHVAQYAELSSAYAWLTEHAMGSPIDVRRIVVSIVPVQRPTMQIPDGVVIAPLSEWPTVPARFALARNLQPWQVDRWSLGYAVTGMLAGRLFLPAWGPGGELQNYTARSFIRSPLRYRSAERSEGLVDGALFGEQMWPEENRDVVVVTEGVLNALAVERAMQVPVAAMFGSEIYLEHLNKLSTFARVVVLTDPDLAGDRAAERLEQAFARHKPILRATLPRGVDANDLEQRDPGALRKVVRNAAGAR
jgi:5S rRNA maturation endonuclease (ribonuclease M5)